MEIVKLKIAKYAENQAFSDRRYSEIWSDSRELSENVFSSKFVDIVPVAQIESSLRLFSRIDSSVRQL